MDVLGPKLMINKERENDSDVLHKKEASWLSKGGCGFWRLHWQHTRLEGSLPPHYNDFMCLTTSMAFIVNAPDGLRRVARELELGWKQVSFCLTLITMCLLTSRNPRRQLGRGLGSRNDGRQCSRGVP